MRWASPTLTPTGRVARSLAIPPTFSSAAFTTRGFWLGRIEVPTYHFSPDTSIYRPPGSGSILMRFFALLTVLALATTLPAQTPAASSGSMPDLERFSLDQVDKSLDPCKDF